MRTNKIKDNYEKFTGNLECAIESLKQGNFVLIHDSSGRENETDFVIAAQFVKPRHIAAMREDGGGLICVAVDKKIAEKIGLPFECDIQKEACSKFPLLGQVLANDIPYDEHSAFSITINHRKTFTGITDNDRALTISEFAELAGSVSKEDYKGDVYADFGKNFRSPGHVHLLISSGLQNREGHTELSTALLKMADLVPCAVLCEMMDSKTHNSLKSGDAKKYAVEQGIIFLESGEVREAFENLQGNF